MSIDIIKTLKFDDVFYEIGKKSNDKLIFRKGNLLGKKKVNKRLIQGKKFFRELNLRGVNTNEI